MSADVPPALNRSHLTRLMKVWRSAGWPCRDPIELDLIAAGLLSVQVSGLGHETLKLTDAGFQMLVASRQRNLRAMSRHERLVQRVARQLNEAGRLVWTELALRALVKPDEAETPVQAAEPAPPFDPGPWQQQDLSTGLPVLAPPEPKGVWRMARPDVFAVRHTSVEAYLQPVVHEIKVSRADLLSDLRHAAKRESYQWLCSACYYVFPVGVAKPNEIPTEFGVWVLHGDLDTGRLEQLRPARHAPHTVPFAVWMALARATPWREETPQLTQGMLGEPDEHAAPDAPAA